MLVISVMQLKYKSKLNQNPAQGNRKTLKRPQMMSKINLLEIEQFGKRLDFQAKTQSRQRQTKRYKNDP